MVDVLREPYGEGDTKLMSPKSTERLGNNRKRSEKEPELTDRCTRNGNKDALEEEMD